jgi:hypothetical protein
MKKIILLSGVSLGGGKDGYKGQIVELEDRVAMGFINRKQARPFSSGIDISTIEVEETEPKLKPEDLMPDAVTAVLETFEPVVLEDFKPEIIE